MQLTFDSLPLDSEYSADKEVVVVRNFVQMTLELRSTERSDIIIDAVQLRLRLNGFPLAQPVHTTQLPRKGVAFSNWHNRLDSSLPAIIMIHMGPSRPTYCTRHRNLVLRPGDLVAVSRGGIFYALDMLEAGSEFADASVNTAIFWEVQH